MQRLASDLDIVLVTLTFEFNLCLVGQQLFFVSLDRAATFTRVNDTVSCFSNKRLQNWPTVYTTFSM